MDWQKVSIGARGLLLAFACIAIIIWFSLNTYASVADALR